MSVMRQQIRGLTLLELVIVLVILGALSALAVPRFSPADNTVAAQADRLARDLRHAQALAMNQGRSLAFDITSTASYRVSSGSSTITDPATRQPFQVTLENSVSVSGSGTGFDSLGRPLAGSNLLDAPRTYTLTGTSRAVTVTLSPVTGFVAVSP